MAKLVLKKGLKIGKVAHNDHWKVQTILLDSSDVSNILGNGFLGGSGLTVTMTAGNDAVIDTVDFSSSNCEMGSRHLVCKQKDAKISWSPKGKSGSYSMIAAFGKRALPALQPIQTPLHLYLNFTVGILESTTSSCSLSQKKQTLKCK